jgi:hypothetical protein
VPSGPRGALGVSAFRAVKGSGCPLGAPCFGWANSSDAHVAEDEQAADRITQAEQDERDHQEIAEYRAMHRASACPTMPPTPVTLACRPTRHSGPAGARLPVLPRCDSAARTR